MIDQAGSDSAISTATQNAAASLVSTLIQEEELGWNHQALRQLGATGVWRALLAIYATGRSDLLPAAHDYDFLRAELSPDGTGFKIGMDTHGDFIDELGDPVTLEGPFVEELLESPNAFESELPLSGSTLFELSGVPAGSFSLEATGDAGVDLHIAVRKVQ